MADDKECKCSPLQWAQAAGIFVVMVLGAWNHNKLDDVKDTQGLQVERAGEVRKSLDKQTEQQDRQLGKIERNTTAVSETIGPQLFATWQYLKSNADYDKTEQSKAKAEEARIAYESYVRKK